MSAFSQHRPKNSCEQCRCWQRFDGEVKGICRANPPVPFPNGSAHQPITRTTDYCINLFQPRGTEAPEIKTKFQPHSPLEAARLLKAGK